METKNANLKPIEKWHIDYQLEPPNNVDLNHINQDEVQSAFNSFFNAFFQQYPETLNQIFNNQNNTQEKHTSELPQITNEKRDAILLALMENSDNETEDLNLNDIKKSQHNKQYTHNFDD